MCIMCRVPEECVIYCDEDSPRLQASDWPELITWPQYWLLIGQFSASNTSHWLIVSRDELMTLISLLCLIFPVSQVRTRRDQSEGCVSSHWPIRGPAELVCRTFPCRFVTLGLTPAAEEGDPNTINLRLGRENILMGFRTKLNQALSHETHFDSLRECKNVFVCTLATRQMIM